ncbi:phage/plasmid replication protein, II/X family [uncultured Shewanella sp.]|uniref:phage/plasmid replication protein, II/X family n=1 Tax=uncultured Shewanella sp. TaxID=173975 RepID=UPI00260547CB|nr:phage/plasmid replication protein, II/X family [uncultured Shewanella sp.]
MIDWATVEIPFKHKPIATDRYVKVSADGEVQFETVCRMRVTGSYESTIGVKSLGSDGEGNATHILLDGNPSKFLQGHNVFGSNDFLNLVLTMSHYVLGTLGLKFSSDEYWQVMRGEYRVTRVDINESFELNNLLSVRSWLKAAELKSKTRHGRPTSKGGTVYWGQHSRRWALKAYCKYDEINSGKKHQLPESLTWTDIPKWAESKLRIELVLRGMQLVSEGITEAKDLTETRINELYNSYLGRLEMAKNVTLTSSKVLELPRKLQSTYMLWTQGLDLKSLLPKPTFYRHRKDLLAYDIDINMSCDTPNMTNVVPLLQVLEAQPVGVPDWAYEQGLVYDRTSHRTGLRVA